MTTKKKTRAEKTVESIFFGRPAYRRAVAKANLKDALHHTLKVIEKGETSPEALVSTLDEQNENGE